MNTKYKYLHNSNYYGPEAWVSAPIKPVSPVARMLYNNALALNLTQALVSCMHKYISVSNPADMHPSVIRRANPDHTRPRPRERARVALEHGPPGTTV